MDDESKTPIRRGKGMRLSTQSGDAAPAPTEPAAPAEGQPLPAPSVMPAAPVEPEPVSSPQPVVRRRGLRLSTQGEEAAGSVPSHGSNDVPAEALPLPSATARRRVVTATGPLSYLAAGTGDPLLLLHGFGATARIWAGALDALADLRSLYALDLPGFGASPPRSAPPTLPALAAEVIACADALGIVRFDLLGHSLGAAVAVVLAAHHPGRVRRLVTVSLAARLFAPELAALGLTRAPMDLTLGLARPLFDMWQPVSRAVMQSPPLDLTMSALVLHGRPISAELWQGYLADHAAADPRAYLTALMASGDPILHEALHAVAAPTLCIAGREDRVARLPEATAAQAMLPGGTLAVLDGCGHIPMIERPEAFHAAVRAFLVG